MKTLRLTLPVLATVSCLLTPVPGQAAGLDAEGFAATAIVGAVLGENYQIYDVPTGPLTQSKSFVDARSDSLGSARAASSLSANYGAIQLGVLEEVLTDDPSRYVYANAWAAGTVSDSITLESLGAPAGDASALLAFDVSALPLEGTSGPAYVHYRFFLQTIVWLGGDPEAPNYDVHEMTWEGEWNIAWGEFTGVTPGRFTRPSRSTSFDS